MMYSNTAKGQLLICQQRVIEIMGCPGAALDARCSWSVSTCCDCEAEPFSIYSCSRAAERVLQRHMTLLFHFLVEQENLCMTSTEQNMLRQRQVFGISVTSATSTVILLFYACVCRLPLPSSTSSSTSSHPGYLLTLTLSLRPKMNSRRGLVRTRSTRINLPSTPNLLNYSNGANPMHFLIVQYV